MNLGNSQSTVTTMELANEINILGIAMLKILMLTTQTLIRSGIPLGQSPRARCYLTKFHELFIHCGKLKCAEGSVA